MKLFIQTLLSAASFSIFLSQECVAMMSAENSEPPTSTRLRRSKEIHQKESAKSVSFTGLLEDTNSGIHRNLRQYTKNIPRSFSEVCDDGNGTTDTDGSSFESVFSGLNLNKESGLKAPGRSRTPENLRNGKVAPSSLRKKGSAVQIPPERSKGAIRILPAEARQAPPLRASISNFSRTDKKNPTLERSCGNLSRPFP